MRKNLLLAIACLALASCSFVKIYHAPTQHGLPVTQLQLDGLQEGMSDAEIARRIGSPPINDPLHPNLWIYPYSRAENGQETHRQLVIIHFNEEGFSHYDIRGDILAK